jgi:hypothetical protein
MVLGLRQKILALTRLQTCQCNIIPQAVPVDRQVVEVPVTAQKVLTKLVYDAVPTLTDIQAIMNHEFGETQKSKTPVFKVQVIHVIIVCHYMDHIFEHQRYFAHTAYLCVCKNLTIKAIISPNSTTQLKFVIEMQCFVLVRNL